MGNSFGVGRQRLSRNLKKLSIYPALTKFYDREIYSRLERIAAKRISKELQAVTKSDVEKVEHIFQSLRPLVPKTPLVRIGPAGDGGYLVPVDYLEIDSLFSPGVAGSSDFELEFAAHGIPCFLADASVDGPATPHEKFYFTKKFIGVQNNETTMTLQSWVEEAPSPGVTFALQMDIEGAEWDIIPETDVDLLRRFRFVIIELHDLQKVFYPEVREKMSLTLRKLKEAFFVADFHVNNFAYPITVEGKKFPRTIELLLLNKDFYGQNGEFVYPNPLNVPNNPNLPDQQLPSLFRG